MRLLRRHCHRLWLGCLRDRRSRLGRRLCVRREGGPSMGFSRRLDMRLRRRFCRHLGGGLQHTLKTLKGADADETIGREQRCQARGKLTAIKFVLTKQCWHGSAFESHVVFKQQMTNKNHAGGQKLTNGPSYGSPAAWAKATFNGSGSLITVLFGATMPPPVL